MLPDLHTNFSRGRSGGLVFPSLSEVQAAATGALKRRRLRQAQPRGATSRPRSGVEAGRTPCPKGGGQEELHQVRGQGQRLRVPDCDGAGTAERSYPASEVRGGGWEELPHAPKPEAKGGGGEEQPHARGQGRWPGGPTPRPRSRGCTGPGGPRGAIPR